MTEVMPRFHKEFYDTKGKYFFHYLGPKYIKVNLSLQAVFIWLLTKLRNLVRRPLCGLEPRSNRAYISVFEIPHFLSSGPGS